ncbi:hypothetical protein GCM10009665_18400 [Kitasatospora nipponensis]|uniref:Phosphoribosyltransferase domain-containing protein n=1 Tax=Kitasatospora nipponensis TaxID=258049 RepID=A0ABN1VZB8_9ACTN
MRRLLIAHKERGVLPLAGPLGGLLATAVRAATCGAVQGTAREGAPQRSHPGAPHPLLLVPMPSARRAVRARGHDPTLRLARRAARVLNGSGLPCVAAPVLRPRRRVADQSGLGAAARHRNLHGALHVPSRFHRRLSGRQLVLVDDLVTTGASLAEAARALHEAGAPPLAAATVAATAHRRHPHGPGAGPHPRQGGGRRQLG